MEGISGFGGIPSGSQFRDGLPHEVRIGRKQSMERTSAVIEAKSPSWFSVLKSKIVAVVEKIEEGVIHPIELSTELVEKGSKVTEAVEVFFKIGAMMKSVTEKLEWLNAPLAIFTMLSLLSTGWEIVTLDPNIGIGSRVLSGIEFLGISGEVTEHITKIVETVGKMTHMASYSMHALKIAGAVGVVVSALTLIASVRGLVQTRMELQKYRDAIGAGSDRDIGKGIEFLKNKDEKKLRSLLNVTGHIPLVEKKVNLGEKIKAAFDRATTDQKKADLNKLIEKQFRISTITKALAAVAAVASIIGVIVLTFTPAAPVAWVFILAGIGISVGLLAYNKIQSRQFIAELERMAQDAPLATPPPIPYSARDVAELVPVTASVSRPAHHLSVRPLSAEHRLHPPQGGVQGQSKRNLKLPTMEQFTEETQDLERILAKRRKEQEQLEEEIQATKRSKQAEDPDLPPTDIQTD
ncbi:MAG: hypothetical protein KDK65_05755 [Chlamydiia bacterium]|nr:hypothetical protein [Chlamydiia bacterium]